MPPFADCFGSAELIDRITADRARDPARLTRKHPDDTASDNPSDRTAKAPARAKSTWARRTA